VIETARLTLRPWIDADLEQFVALVTDPAVGEWLGGARSREQALGDFDGMRAFWNVHGNGWLAAVRKDDCAVIGRVACRRLPAEWRHPMGRVVELGWALLPATWGRGYASEAAAAMLNWGFGALATPTIYAWTAAGNVRSQAVMRRIGMARAPGCDFDHPDLAADDPLRHHVVYLARRLQ
jgi:RimJ/RimL family protein N-acetyltransferase